MKFPERPLGYVREALNRMNHDISYSYDNLVFPDHSDYLIEFADTNEELNLYFNEECSDAETELLRERLILELAANTGFSLNFRGLFNLQQCADEQIKLSLIKS